MYFRPSTAFGSVSERMMTMTSMTNSAGIPILLNFSMPSATPPLTITIQMNKNSAVNTAQPNGLSSIAPNVAPPASGAPKMSDRLNDSSAMFSDIYWMQ